MRSLGDRIRHAISFEIIGLLVVAPLGAWAFQFPLDDIGIVAVVSATIATVWNLAFNYLFDLILQRTTGNTAKSGPVRVVHAVLFEVGLLAVLMPFIAWYLGVPLLQALVIDLSFALFYMVYAFVFGWAYDRLYPLPEWSEAR